MPKPNLNSKELQFAIATLIEDLISAGRKTKGYRDAAVFISPQRSSSDEFLISFRTGKLDAQEIKDLERAVKGLDLKIDYQAEGITQDRQRIVLKPANTKDQKKSTPPLKNNY